MKITPEVLKEIKANFENADDRIKQLESITGTQIFINAGILILIALITFTF